MNWKCSKVQRHTPRKLLLQLFCGFYCLILRLHFNQSFIKSLSASYFAGFASFGEYQTVVCISQLITITAHFATFETKFVTLIFQVEEYFFINQILCLTPLFKFVVISIYPSLFLYIWHIDSSIILCLYRSFSIGIIFDLHNDLISISHSFYHFSLFIYIQYLLQTTCLHQFKFKSDQVD